MYLIVIGWLYVAVMMAVAEAFYAEAAECEPMDAMERLDVEAAREELEDE